MIYGIFSTNFRDINDNYDTVIMQLCENSLEKR